MQAAATSTAGGSEVLTDSSAAEEVVHIARREYDAKMEFAVARAAREAAREAVQALMAASSNVTHSGGGAD